MKVGVLRRMTCRPAIFPGEVNLEVLLDSGRLSFNDISLTVTVSA